MPVVLPAHRADRQQTRVSVAANPGEVCCIIPYKSREGLVNVP